MMYIRPELRAPIITGVVAATSGLGIGYILGRRKMQTTTETHIEYETVVECEVCKKTSSEQHGMVNIIDTEGYATADVGATVDLASSIYGKQLRDQAQADMRAIVEGHPSTESGLTLVPDETLDDPEDWPGDAVAELEEERSVDTPYVISKVEWDQDERGFQQLELRWFTGDKILVNEENEPIPRPEHVVGRLEFGRASGDGNVVYIRNESLVAEYRIERVDGYYITEVMGIEAEEAAEAEDIKHSQRILKFRD